VAPARVVIAGGAVTAGPLLTRLHGALAFCALMWHFRHHGVVNSCPCCDSQQGRRLKRRGITMTCLVTMLAREERRLSHIFCNTDEADPAHDDACEAMEVCRLMASWAPAPKTEEGCS
jgi:hypothetical protein